MFMQTDVKAVAESAVGGRAEVGMMRKSGRVFLNHGFGEVSSESHWPVAVVASLSRLRTSVSGDVSVSDVVDGREVRDGVGCMEVTGSMIRGKSEAGMQQSSKVKKKEYEIFYILIL